MKQSLSIVLIYMAISGALSSHASIVHYENQNTEERYIDINGDGMHEMYLFANFMGIQFSYANGTLGLHRTLESPVVGTLTEAYLADLPVGFEIPSIVDSNYTWLNNGHFAFGTTGAEGTLGPGETAYVGISFQINSNTHYAWMQVNWPSVDPDNSFKIVEWAYESQPETGIAVAAIPEPHSIVLFTIAGVGLFRIRKRNA